MEKHMVQRLRAGPRGVDENPQVGARLLLADKVVKRLRPEGSLRPVLLRHLGGDHAIFAVHRACSLDPSSESPALIRTSTLGPDSPGFDFSPEAARARAACASDAP